MKGTKRSERLKRFEESMFALGIPVPRARAKRKKPRPKVRQLEMNWSRRGGRREGAGRPKESGSGVPHTKRAGLASRHPVHVTATLRQGLPSLRRTEPYDVLRGAFEKGCERFGFRLVHYSVQEDHLHLLCEAKDREALSRGLQGLFVRIAKALNKLWKRKGKVFADRYHDVILRTPMHVRRALIYVFRNAEKHGWRGRRFDEIDSFTSANFFDGWKEGITTFGDWRRPVAAARTWLMNVGWLKHGRLGARELPKGLYEFAT